MGIAVGDVQPGELAVRERRRVWNQVVGGVDGPDEYADLTAARPGEAEAAAAAGTEAALDLRRGLEDRGRAFDPHEILGPEPDVGQERRAGNPPTPLTVTVDDPERLAPLR